MMFSSHLHRLIRLPLTIHRSIRYLPSSSTSSCTSTCYQYRTLSSMVTRQVTSQQQEQQEEENIREAWEEDEIVEIKPIKKRISSTTTTPATTTTTTPPPSSIITSSSTLTTSTSTPPHPPSSSTRLWYTSPYHNEIHDTMPPSILNERIFVQVPKHNITTTTTIDSDENALVQLPGMFDAVVLICL